MTVTIFVICNMTVTIFVILRRKLHYKRAIQYQKVPSDTHFILKV